MNITQIRTHTGKACKINPSKAAVKKKGVLNLTLHERFNTPYRNTNSLFTRNSIDLPQIGNFRLQPSLNSSQKIIHEGYNAIAQVQSVPLTPMVVLKQFQTYLTKFEVVEILDYPEIHFLGMKAKKTIPSTSDVNCGYDDERNDYKVVLQDHIAYRYEVQQLIGKGSFGQVCMCFDHKFKMQVAIKIIRNQTRFHKQGRIEVKVLNVLKENSENTNTVTMYEHFLFRKHLCICFELLSVNLYEMLKINSFHGFSQRFIKKIAVQVLNCLQNLRELQIIHCDLKPENILMKKNPKRCIKVIDFGSSCFLNEKIHAYIQSRFYRAPEVILGINYKESIDMWSFGCIIAELALGFPLFPGESEAEQIQCIMEIRGVPPDYVIEKALKKKNFFEGNSPKIVANSRGKRRVPGGKSLETILKNCDGGFLDLLDSNFYLECLDWDSERRISPAAALGHAWLIM